MATSTCESMDTRRFLGIADAAAYCGLGASTLRRWLAEGRLTALRPSRRVLIDRAELDALIRGGGDQERVRQAEDNAVKR